MMAASSIWKLDGEESKNFLVGGPISSSQDMAGATGPGVIGSGRNSQATHASTSAGACSSH
jgi:hypothetical protein